MPLGYDDFMDPLGAVQRLAYGPRQTNFSQQAKPEIPPLSLEEEERLLPKIGSAALGGLGYVGSVLEKTFGGRAIRGALGGKPRELLSVLPGSDLLGITDEADRVSGKELLQNAGVIGGDDSWGNFGAGLAAEIALDPSMYLTFGSGALSKAGQVAQKVGRTPKGATARVGGNLRQILAKEPGLQQAAETAAGGAGNLAGMMDAPLGGLFGWHVPFTNAGGTFLEGASGLKAIERAKGGVEAVKGAHSALNALPYGGGWAYQLGTLGLPHLVGGAVKYGGKALDAAGRYGRALFDASAMGATTKVGQEAAEEAFRGILPLQASSRQKALEYGERLAALGVKDADEFRSVLEGVAPHANPEVNAIADAMRADLAATRAQADRLGINVREWADPGTDVGYFPRQWSPPVKVSGGAGDPTAPLRAVDARLMTGRESVLEGFNEGTVGVNKLILDPKVYEGTPLERAAYIRDNYLATPQASVQQQLATGQIVNNPQILSTELKSWAGKRNHQAKALLDWIDQLPAEYRASIGTDNPLRFFGNSPVADYMSYYDRMARLQSSAEAAQNLVARNVIDQGALAAGQSLPKGAKTVEQALREAGLVSPTLDSGAVGEALARVNKLRTEQGLAPLTDLSGQYVAPEIAGELGRYMTSFRNPEALNPVVRGLDWLTNLFKGYVTAPFPGFHVRNLVSGQAQNVATAGPGVLKSVPDAYRILGGGAAEGLQDLPLFAGRNLTAEEATKEVARMAAAYNVAGHSSNVGRDIVGASGQAVTMPRSLDDVLATIPGHRPTGVTEPLRTLAGGKEGTSWLRPLDIGGVNANADVFTPIVAGRQMGDVVEGVNRLPLFIDSLRQGFAPEEAARRVLAAQYDYTRQALTPFEKTVMRRMMPFYSFTRQNVPAVLGQIARRPGGLAGVTAKAALDARQEPGKFLPAYMGEGLAIPVGGETAEGIQRYLTRVDTPAEAAFEMLKGTPRQTLMGLAGQLNPVFKGPLEYATDRQFFSGRELGDLYSMTGNQLLDHLIANSPLARVGSTARTLTDPRKYADPYALPLNLLTGAKVTDVDMPKYRAIAEREYLKEALRGVPAVGKFETFYVRPEQLGTLTPEELELVRLQKTLQARAREASKKKIRVEGQ
jgi:hypothetical protein